MEFAVTTMPGSIRLVRLQRLAAPQLSTIQVAPSATSRRVPGRVSKIVGMIRIGAAGWQYRDWQGIVYPNPKPRGFRELGYIASLFDTVEINTSFYGPPRPATTQQWIDLVADNPEFRFTAKLWKGFTHDRSATAKDNAM